jgi:hypothetical protein
MMVIRKIKKNISEVEIGIIGQDWFSLQYGRGHTDLKSKQDPSFPGHSGVTAGVGRTM